MKNSIIKIELSEEKVEYLKNRAKISGKSINEILAELIEKEKKGQQGKNAAGSLYRLVGLFKSGLKDLSMEHNKYLYSKS